jgi:enoyl-CoA hydratase/carnithine racemase
MEELVLVEIKDYVATLTLNRPEAMNSFNVAMVKALGERLAALRFDKSARVVIVTGSGDKAFSAGADLKERAGMTPEQVKEFIFNIRRLMEDKRVISRKS